MASGPPFPSRPSASGRRAVWRPDRAARSPPAPWAARPPAPASPDPAPSAQPLSGRPAARDLRRLLGHLGVAREREAPVRGGRAQAGVVLGLPRLRNTLGFSQAMFVGKPWRDERLLHRVTITSLRHAVKVNEEEELIPHVKDFIKHYGSGYTPNELLRVELAVLDRLHWDLCIGTPLDFLITYGVFCSNAKNHGLQFHALVVLSWPHELELLPQRNPSLHAASLTRQLQHCMAGHQLLQFKGSTLALVIITLELERLMPDCCAPISDLLKKAQVSLEQYNGCRELSSFCMENSVSPAN
uniref:Cyclin I family member 2 n=1 Tax=Propithecus coquereli TaxID=379532 RepID=A0A2K6G0S1_PROCO